MTGGFLAIRATKYEVRQRTEPPPQQWVAFSIDRLRSDLHLEPEQEQKVRSILQQMADELNNLRSLDARETEGIFSRAKDRIDPVLKRDQRAQLQQFLEDRKPRVEESPSVPEPRP